MARKNMTSLGFFATPQSGHCFECGWNGRPGVLEYHNDLLLVLLRGGQVELRKRQHGGKATGLDAWSPTGILGQVEGVVTVENPLAIHLPQGLLVIGHLLLQGEPVFPPASRDLQARPPGCAHGGVQHSFDGTPAEDEDQETEDRDTSNQDKDAGVREGARLKAASDEGGQVTIHCGRDVHARAPDVPAGIGLIVPEGPDGHHRMGPRGYLHPLGHGKRHVVRVARWEAGGAEQDIAVCHHCQTQAGEQYESQDGHAAGE
mmetsp:Transcript_40840/g.122054  ORF Transcript_40840/g.122054 Transcript_40840/m.122054 type:complete len:260 (-) Transcript_40840:1490-2269(-)